MSDRTLLRGLHQLSAAGGQLAGCMTGWPLTSEKPGSFWSAWASFGFTFAGWLLAAVVVAGLSGVFKRD
jgi:hypothetical protein